MTVGWNLNLFLDFLTAVSAVRCTGMGPMAAGTWYWWAIILMGDIMICKCGVLNSCWNESDFMVSQMWDLCQRVTRRMLSNCQFGLYPVSYTTLDAGYDAWWLMSSLYFWGCWTVRTCEIMVRHKYLIQSTPKCLIQHKQEMRVLTYSELCTIPIRPGTPTQAQDPRSKQEPKKTSRISKGPAPAR